jgi:hypothetical protein
MRGPSNGPEEIPVGMQPYVPIAGEPIPAGILDDILAGKRPNYVDFEVQAVRAQRQPEDHRWWRLAG